MHCRNAIQENKTDGLGVGLDRAEAGMLAMPHYSTFLKERYNVTLNLFYVLFIHFRETRLGKISEA